MLFRYKLSWDLENVSKCSTFSMFPQNMRIFKKYQTKKNKWTNIFCRVIKNTTFILGL